MTYRLLVVLVLILAGMLYFRGPSAGRVVAATYLAADEGYLEYRGKRYAAEWGDPVVHQGDIRQIGRAHYKFAPFFTHHAVVTTGDFSDPDLVNVSPFRDGSIIWSAPQQPDGSLVVLHFLPADPLVLKDLAGLREGNCARLAGREELDSDIRAEDGAFVRLNSSNHRYLLLEGVRNCA